MLRVGLLLMVAAGAAVVAQDTARPRVPGAERAGLESRVRGQVLLDELGCANCHGGAEERVGPDLTGLAERADPAWIRSWLAAPHEQKPGTTMPDLLRDRNGSERLAAATALTAWLIGDAGERPFRREAHDATAAARGHELFQSIGCAACHASRDAQAKEQNTDGSVPLGDLSVKYSSDALRTFLLDPLATRPHGRMPDFGLSPQEAYDLAEFLTTPREGLRAGYAGSEAELRARGAVLFTELRCASCHAGPTDATTFAAATPLASADPTRGCLAERPSGAGIAVYDLSQSQRSDLRAALASEPLTADERVLAHLAARNCTACHERGAHGGPDETRADLFSGTDLALGMAGRFPPPLTAAGDKLQTEWLQRTIAHGQRERPYLNTRMPGFGEAFGDALTPLLVEVDRKTDEAPITPLPDDRDGANRVKDLGRELVGDKGMGCIACHTFAGQDNGAMHAIDLVHSTGQRLRPEWFRRYMQQPNAYRSMTIMPQFFLGEKSTRPDLGDGSSAQQIAALWHYLAEGRNVRRPSGLRSEPIELTVADEAVILRRAVQNTGKRGISVGYAGGVNITFDAETLAMNQIWWGRFLDVAPVFHGQGSGQAHIPTRERADLGRGPAFLSDTPDDGPPPEKLRRAAGQLLRGYDLDDRGRPTFRYTIGEIRIEDRCEEFTDPGQRIALRRTLTLTSPTAGRSTFRVAHGPRIVPAEGRLTFLVGDHLSVKVSEIATHLEDRGEGRMELVSSLDLEAGKPTVLTLVYRWMEEGR